LYSQEFIITLHCKNTHLNGKKTIRENITNIFAIQATILRTD